MVVVEHAAPVASGTPPPPILGILFGRGKPIVTLLVQEYSWWKLGSTRVQSVASKDHKQLVGKWFPSLAAASQHCSHTITGAPSEYMRTVKVPFLPQVPHIIATAPARCTLSTFEPVYDPWATAHVDTHVHQPIELTGDECMVEIGRCRPFIPLGMPRLAALEREHWAHLRPAEGGGDASARDMERPWPICKVKRDAKDLLAVDQPAEGPSVGRGKRPKRNAKVPLQKGACVWEGKPAVVPPVALVIEDVWEDPGDAAHECTKWLYLKSLDGKERRVWRRIPEVSNFDEELPKMYGERRAMLVEHGAWADTAGMVRLGLLHRLLLTPDLTAAEIWSRRMKMKEEPCPVTEEEAADWRRGVNTASLK